MNVIDRFIRSGEEVGSQAASGHPDIVETKSYFSDQLKVSEAQLFM